MTRYLALLILSVTLVSCMEMKETVQRMIMVRTSGSDTKPEANGFIYKRESDGHPKVIKMGQDEVMEELTKMYKFPQAFEAPIPFAAGPFYNKEDDSDKIGLTPKVIPVFENIEESNEIKSDSVPAAAEHDQSQLYAPNQFDDYASDFNDYLASLGYHDDFYRGGSWFDYGNSDQLAVGPADSSPNQYRYNIDNETPEGYSTQKYEIYTLSTTDGDKPDDKNKDSDTASSDNNNKRLEYSDKDNSKARTYSGDFRKEGYASQFDGYSKNTDYEKPYKKKIDKYDGDFDLYENKKDSDDSYVNEGRDFFNSFHNVAPKDKANDEERTDHLDLNGRVAQELRDCCYEEKPQKDDETNEDDIEVQFKSDFYKVR